MHPIWTAVSFLTGQRVRVRAPARGRQIYLTFDDGPDPQHTPPILDLLARFDAKATFFMVGRHIEAAAPVVRRILAEGHTIANHSMNHPRMPKVPWHRQWAEFDHADAVLSQFDGKARHLVRPPGGEATVTMIAGSVLRGQSIVLWSIDSLDYRLAADQVVSHLERRPLRDGDILLFHDDGPSAVQALARLLPLWQAAGWHFPAL
jgi:peptidoglycan-N-acetylglucosamine deacetylase